MGDHRTNAAVEKKNLLDRIIGSESRKIFDFQKIFAILCQVEKKDEISFTAIFNDSIKLNYSLPISAMGFHLIC